MGNFCYHDKQTNSNPASELPQSNANQINVFVVGAEQVGKDSLISKLCQFGDIVGLGEDKPEKQMKYEQKLIVFRRLKKSTPEFFQMNYKTYLKDIEVVLLCVDLAKAQTLQSFSDSFFEKIIEYVRQQGNRSFRVIIVGLKSDKQCRNKNEEDALNKKCRELQLPFIKVSSLEETNIQQVLNEIMNYRDKNLTSMTIEEKISNLQNSRYVDVHSSLRDGGSNLSIQPTPTNGMRSQPAPAQIQPHTISQIIANAPYDDEESKIDTRSSNNQQIIQQPQQQYIRIIPHEKMYVRTRMQLDKGNFGVVYRIELEGETCALKICKIEMNDETAMNRFQIIFSEAENMQRFMLNRNMRIMPLKGISFQVDMQRQNVLIGYWMPLCKYSLKYLLKNCFNQITINLKIKWSLQIIECLEVFFKEKIQHMDLKPQNILLDQNDDIIVSDLSMSKVFEEKHTEAFNMLGTTAKYAHPAAIINHELSPRFDIYSFGVILLELFTGKQPWGQVKRDELKDIYTQILTQPEIMNPLRYHKENYPNDMKYIEGKYQPIQDIIYMCCVSIFIKEKKDDITINKIKLKFKELQESIIPTSA
ncbi:hypothetical protein ABPG72_019147 [Tetrahymena utriculariae]